jgi:hypothetical protein
MLYMNHRLLLAFLSIFALGVLLTPAASAQSVALIDYVGYAWEDGGIPPSFPGDILAINAVATQMDPLFNIDLVGEEVTIYIYGLISTGEIADVPAPGFTTTSYVGGTIEVYEDPLMDHDWGALFGGDPAGDVGTFNNGALLFQGDFTSFVLFLDSSGAGSFEGTVDGVVSTVAELCTDPVDCAYTFGGAFGQGVPDGSGYHLQIDGTLEVDAAVPNDVASFGAIKALYQD